jgi:hypothetical protein
LTATTGAFVFLPRRLPHTFRVDSGSARLLTVMQPGGSLAMFGEAEEQFGARGMPAVPRPADLERVARALGRFGLSIVGPNPRPSR